MSYPKKRSPPARVGFDKTCPGGRDEYNTALAALYLGDPRIEFLDAIRDAGIPIAEPDKIEADGSIRRFHVEGDKPGTRNGWCVLFTDMHGAGGAFGHWRSGATGTWHQGRGNVTAAERKRLTRAIADATRQREAERMERAQGAAQRAVELWQQAAAADPAHPYLMAKHVEPHGIRQLDDKLVIPLRDADGKLWSLQFIAPGGTKRFLCGGRKRGCYFSIGRVDDELLIAEGLATAASLHENTGKAVAVAFDAGNLEPVARTLRAKFLTTTITICADNDVATPGNPGLTKGTQAARAVGGKVTIPAEPFNDFNDMAMAVQS